MRTVFRSRRVMIIGGSLTGRQSAEARAGISVSHKLRHGMVLRASATLVDLTLVLWTPGPIISHREEFLPEGLRAYGRPLYTVYKLKVSY
jgi:hypothetical protein